jgi:hypothetical protein
MEEGPPNLEGIFEYIEYAVADSLQLVVLQFGGWGVRRRLTTKQLLTVKYQ